MKRQSVISSAMGNNIAEKIVKLLHTESKTANLYPRMLNKKNSEGKLLVNIGP